MKHFSTSFLVCIVVIIIIVVATPIFLFRVASIDIDTNVKRASAEIHQLYDFVFFENYSFHYSFSSNVSTTVSEWIRHKDPKQSLYYGCLTNDPWREPYYITIDISNIFTSTDEVVNRIGHVKIWSSGANKSNEWGKGDDINGLESLKANEKRIHSVQGKVRGR